MQATGSNSPQTTYRLSIHALVDGFSVSVSDSAGRQTQLAQQTVPDGDNQLKASALRAALTDSRVSSRTFTQVELVSHAPSTYVPVELFRRSDAASLYRLTFSNARVGNADIRHRILSGMDAVEVFALSQAVAQVVADLFPQAVLKGRAGQLIELAAEADSKSGSVEPCMHVCAEGRELHVCLLAGGQLRYACSYEAHSDADRIYFLMAVWRNLNLDAQKTRCLVSGGTEILKKELTNYILHVEVCA